jgi:methionine sulfoxide reductase heme-binding subunit
MAPRGEPRWFGPALFLLACLPAVLGVGAMASDILTGSRHFGSNPIKAGEHFYGQWTLRFLVATLSITPLRSLLGLPWLGRHRRRLGLFAFAYLMLHWLTYALLDVQLDWGELKTDLAKRPYIMVGMLALVLMVPLAATSSAAAIRRLGGVLWSRLHRLVYLVATLGVVHYWMSVKRDITGPLAYAAVFAVLFVHRIARWRGASAARPAA